MSRPLPTGGQTQLPASLIILGITVVVFFLQGNVLAPWFGHLALWPVGSPDFLELQGQRYAVPGFRPWQLITYGFLHGGLGHVFFNMLALYMFGLPIERAWGTRRFLVFYFVCMAGAALVQLTVAAITGEVYPTIGASGGVFGLLLAFGMMFPNHTIVLLIPPIPMKAKYFVIGYGLLTLFFGITGTMTGVAHFAHLGGMVFGLALILYWGRSDYYRHRR